MKKTIASALFAALSMFAVGSAFAESACCKDPYLADYKFKSTKTRAEVIAEMNADKPTAVATKPAETAPAPVATPEKTSAYKVNDPYSAAHGFVSTKSRDEVYAELVQSKQPVKLAEGAVNDPYSAAHGFVGTKTRDQVIAEMNGTTAPASIQTASK